MGTVGGLVVRQGVSGISRVSGAWGAARFRLSGERNSENGCGEVVTDIVGGGGYVVGCWWWCWWWSVELEL